MNTEVRKQRPRPASARPQKLGNAFWLVPTVLVGAHNFETEPQNSPFGSEQQGYEGRAAYPRVMTRSKHE